ncbi:Glycosyltransferase involved in cell wall bisynthesis [Bosea sp. OK403]|uniref:glycosyltransferase family 2 protein n=1 Tax=Bosea sp. OK403 TaxID=1855286 RepID=UPI0008ECAD59|nr:glycosyltransferase family 2 protein [Bosea sp. OK403]SFH95259.1 Glycosyltransferase involved in cell wall bisynthesis [Bosea sp. OK403]
MFLPATGHAIQRCPASLAIAVLIPCHNEALTIAAVVRSFRESLPGAAIYVYDNNSSDGTAEAARQAGAIVRGERRQGKGYVVRRMFSDVEADIYLLVDGDATYEAEAAPRLVAELLAGPYDKVNGARVHHRHDAYRRGHVLGNRVLTGLVSRIFGAHSRDMLSGYKVLSRRFVKSFPATSNGFEIETELLVHALDLDVPMSEIETLYKERPAGSESKLSTFKDGFRIFGLILHLVRDLLPLQFFTLIGTLFVLSSIGLGVPVILAFIETGWVMRLPTAVLSVGLMIAGLLAFVTGLILDSVARGRREKKLIAYLGHPAAGG